MGLTNTSYLVCDDCGAMITADEGHVVIFTAPPSVSCLCTVCYLEREAQTAQIMAEQERERDRLFDYYRSFGGE